MARGVNATSVPIRFLSRKRNLLERLVALEENFLDKTIHERRDQRTCKLGRKRLSILKINFIPNQLGAFQKLGNTGRLSRPLIPKTPSRRKRQKITRG